jgi:hypothetical protein
VRPLRGRNRCHSGLGSRAGGHLVLPIVELGEKHNPLLTGFDDELAEAVEAGIALVEIGIDLLHDLLQPVGAHHIPVASHLGHRFAGELPWIALGGWCVYFLRETCQVVIGVVLIAILNQQVAGRLSNSDPNHVLPVLFQLDHHRRKVAVPRQENESADLGASEYQLDRVYRKADVGRVFLTGPECRREDEINGGFGQRHDVLGIAPPIGVGALNRNFAFDDVAVEKGAKLFRQILLDAQRDIVKIDQQGSVRGMYLGLTEMSARPN